MQESILQSVSEMAAMRRRFRRGAILSLCWLAIAMALSGWRITSAEFGVQGDLPLHYHITRSFARSFSEGDWLPRWAGLLDGGYGDALFSFYPPLSYLLSSILIQFLGLEVLTSLKLVLLLALVTAQASAYGLARRFFEVRRAMAASILYVVLPSFQLIAMNRGFYANALGLSLAPAALLGAHLVLTSKRRVRSVAFFSLAMSAVILTHAITMYLCGIAIALLIIARFPGAFMHYLFRRDLFRIFPAVAIVFCLTAFFLVPQQIEMKWVRVGLQLVQQDFRHYLLYAPPQDASNYREAWAGLNQVASHVTVAQSLLAFLLACGCGRILWSGENPERSAILRFAVLCAIFGGLISLPLSASVWNYLPGLKYIQFPWRFQPFVAIGCGLLAVALPDAWPRRRRLARMLLVGCLFWIMAANLALSFVLLRFEKTPGGQDAVKAYLFAMDLPAVTIDEAKQFQNDGNLKSLYYAGNQAYFRPNGAGLLVYSPASNVGGLRWVSGEGKILSQTLRNSERVFVLECREASRARLETFAYPHWVARLDGREIPITTEKDEGRMVVDLPAGTHRLTFSFEIRHRIEKAARWLSLLSWLLFGGWIAIWAILAIWERPRD